MCRWIGLPGRIGVSRKPHADRLFGRRGNAFLWGKGGPDLLAGGAGVDFGNGEDKCRNTETRVSCEALKFIVPGVRQRRHQPAGSAGGSAYES